MKRRHFLASAALPLTGCEAVREIQGGFTGVNAARGHQLRERTSWPAPSKTHQTRVVIAGGGVAGLAAGRALRLKGMNDFALLELEDQAGGNSRGGTVGGIACPMGAHYLPVPGDDATELQDLLEELGLRQRQSGRWVYDERYLCHSPQERLFFNGEWQEGLLPLQGVGRDTLAQYQKFAALVAQAQQTSTWTLPASRAPMTAEKHALQALTFKTYLSQNGLTDPHLIWYLNYCCQDDYGAGYSTVSAWAGLHYFASRHGFTAPRADGHDAGSNADREGLLTWPEGNGWLSRQLASPLKARLQTSQVVVRIASTRHGVEVDAFNPTTQATHRWVAERCIVALPIFVAARVLESPPDWLRLAAARTRYAPWLVANLHIKAPLQDHAGAPPSWDNVIYSANPANATASAGLGYVDAMHQSLQSVKRADSPTVLTHYRALGDMPEGRKLLLARPWSQWRDVILAELGAAHPDLAAKTIRIEMTRYGHAMAVPVPIPVPGPVAPAGLRQGRVSFAHSDWAGYSVFEEAFTMGHTVGG